MHTQKIRFGRNKIIFGLATVGVACALLLWSERAREVTRLPSENADVLEGAATIAASASGATGSVSGSHVSRETVSRKHALNPALVSQAITRVFPSIEQRVVDWRGFRPDEITVAPHPDLPVTFKRTALKEDGKYVTWIGRNADYPGASFVGVATAKGYDAVLILPGASEFAFHVRGDEVTVSETSSGEEGCGNFPAQRPLPPKESSAVTVSVAYATGHEPVADAVLASTDVPTVDVLAAYDAETLTRAAQASPSDPAGYLDGQLKARLETGNVVLNQSGVTTFRWRYLGLVPAPAYPRTEKGGDDLDAIAPGGAAFNWAKARRHEHGADQIVLLIGGTLDFGGMAYGPEDRHVTADYASLIMRWNSSAMTLIHELAHNFGCHHDREHTEVLSLGKYGAPAPDNNGKWHYGIMWPNPKPYPTYSYDVGTSGTVMSYSDYDVPYFSNPNISVTVTPSMLEWGWSTNPSLGTHVLGRAETDPKAAYNVKILNDRGVSMSNLVEEIKFPAIVSHPESATATRGLTMGMRVEATGGGLSYQWFKNGTKLEGYTARTWAKETADSDAGDYTVVVSNLAGSVTSNAATITVRSPIVTTPPPPSGSSTNISSSSGVGGGGGGGSPSVWFLTLLGVLTLTRWLGGRCARVNR